MLCLTYIFSSNLLLVYYFLCIIYHATLQVGLVCIRSLNLITASNVINYVLFYPPTTHLLLIRKLCFMTPPTQFTQLQCLLIKLQFAYHWQVRGLVNTTLVYIRCLKKIRPGSKIIFTENILFCPLCRREIPPKYDLAAPMYNFCNTKKESLSHNCTSGGSQVNKWSQLVGNAGMSVCVYEIKNRSLGTHKRYHTTPVCEGKIPKRNLWSTCHEVEGHAAMN